MGIEAVLMGLQVVTSMAGQHEQGKAQQRAYEEQAKLAQQNAAAVAAQRSQMADSYAQKQKQLRDRLRLAEGQANAAAGAAGLSAVGSVSDVIGAGREQYEQDSINLLQQQRNDSWNKYVEHVNYLNQATAYNAAAKNVKKQTRQKMFGTLLSGSASYYNNMMNANTNNSNGGIKG